MAIEIKVRGRREESLERYCFGDRQSACINLGGHWASEDHLNWGSLQKKSAGLRASDQNLSREGENGAEEDSATIAWTGDDVKNINIIINNNL